MGSDDDRPPPPYSTIDPNPGARLTFPEEHGANRPLEPPANVIGAGVVPVAIPVAVASAPSYVNVDPGTRAPPSVSTAGHVDGGASRGCVGQKLWLVGSVVALVVAAVIALVVVHLTVGFSGGVVNGSDALSGNEPSESTDRDAYAHIAQCQPHLETSWEWPAVLNFEGDPTSADPASQLGRLMKSSPENPIRVPLGRCVHIVNAGGGWIFQYQGPGASWEWENCWTWEAVKIGSYGEDLVAVFAPNASGFYYFSDYESQCNKGKKFAILNPKP